MTRPVWYVAHPVAPTEEEIEAYVFSSAGLSSRPISEIRSYAAAPVTRCNVMRAARWKRWLSEQYPHLVFIAPWIGDILAGADDSDPAQREAGLRDCEDTVRACAGIVLVGGRIGSGGRRERAVARAVVDLLHLGAEPPAGRHPAADAAFAELAGEPWREVWREERGRGGGR